jgi:hypothetical protein
MNLKKVNAKEFHIFLFFICLFFLFSNRAYSQWTTPLLLSGNLDGFSNEPNITATKSGKMAVTWTQNLDKYFTKSSVYFREFSNNEWSTIRKISTDTFSVSKPLIISDKNGVYHSTWCERMISSLPMPIMQPPTDIFYSKISNDNISFPQKIFRNRDTLYNLPFGQVCKIDSKNILHVLWSATDSGASLLRYRGLENDQWSNMITLKTGAAYKDIHIDANNRIHLAFIRGYSVVIGESDLNSVLYIYSDDNGKTWSEIQVIQKSGIFGAYTVKIFQDKKNIMHMVWGKDLEGQMIVKNIYHSFSTDGNSWSEPRQIIALSEGQLSDFNIVCDKDNNFHMVIYQIIPTGSGTAHNLLYSRYNTKEWSKPIKIKDFARNLSLCIDSLNRLHLAYIKTSDTIVEPMKLYYMRTIEPVSSCKPGVNTISAPCLLQNYPNPFNPSTQIEYEISYTTHVTVKIFNTLGQMITELVNKNHTPGKYNITWEPGNLPSGLYFYNLNTDGYNKSRSMIFLK